MKKSVFVQMFTVLCSGSAMLTAIGCGSEAQPGTTAEPESVGTVTAAVTAAPKPEITNGSSVAVITASVTPTVCSGTPNGHTYVLLHVSGSGPITSGDPSDVLNGKTFNANAKILDSPDPTPNGYGVSRDDFTITDPANGDAIVAKGTAFATDRGQNSIQSISTMRFAAAYGGGIRWSGATVHLENLPTITVEYGEPRDPTDTNDRSVTVPPSLGANCLAPFLAVPNWFGVNL